MNDLFNLRGYIQGDPTAVLRMQLIVVLAISLVVPIAGLVVSYLRDRLRARRPRGR